MRVQHVQQMKQVGETVFPHKFHVSLALRDFIDKYSSLTNEQTSDDVVSIAGPFFFHLISTEKTFEHRFQVEFIQNVHPVRNFSSTICTVTQSKFKSCRI